MAKHYGVADWIEFVRDMGPLEQREQMNRHLGDGCLDCRHTAEFFKKLVSACLDMIPDEVPETWLKRARSIWPQTTRRLEDAIRIPAELIYDSSLAPTAVGLRASMETGCHVLYRAGDYSLDFVVEQATCSSRISVVGQILKINSEAQMSNIPVTLKWGTTTIGETLSNQFGEFHLECEQRKHVALCVHLEPYARFIDVPLPVFASDKSGELG